MNKEQYLVGKIGEEAAEVIGEICNILENQQNINYTHYENFFHEYVDLMVCVNMFQKGIIGSNDFTSILSFLEDDTDFELGLISGANHIIKNLSEVCKLTSKIQQFGCAEVYEKYGVTNWARLEENFNESLRCLNRMIHLDGLRSFKTLSKNYLQARLNDKEQKMADYLKYSQELGMIDEDVTIV